MKIAYTRAMVNALLAGELEDVPYEKHPIFGLSVPQSCPHVPAEVLNPRATWTDKAAYDRQAMRLAGMFAENFQQYADRVPQSVREAGPQVMRKAPV